MSATAQNFFYLVGKKREGAKENTLSREQYEKAIKDAERFMPKDKNNESEARNIK